MQAEGAHPSFDVLIIGGGVSGLVTAHALQRRSFSVMLVEATARAGGVVATRHHDEFLYETGANSTLDSTPLLSELFAELGIAGERIPTQPLASKRYVVRGGKLLALPGSPPALLASDAFTIRAKLRLLREPFIAPAAAGTDESVASFVRRRLGSEVLDYAVDPFVSGIYAGDPEALSVPAAFPRLHALEQRNRSLLRGLIAQARERRRSGQPARTRAASFSFRNGMQTLPEALARTLEHYADRTPVTSIRHPDGRSFVVEGLGNGKAVTYGARALVIATPAYAAAPLVSSFAPEAARVLASIEYAPVAIAVTAYRRQDVAHALDGFGFLVPGMERRKILGTLFSSSLFEGRAPPGHVLLTTFAGGRRNPAMMELDDDALALAVAGELTELVGARQPLWTEIVRWPRAIPQYEIGHLGRVQAVREAAAPVRGLFFCGSWHGGVAVGDRVTSGHATAEQVAAFLRA